jgi:hypothetical protein
MLGGLAAATVLFASFIGPVPASADACTGAPVGGSNLPGDPEPAAAIWCSPVTATAPSTGAPDGFGGWIDTFANGVSGAAPANIPSAYTLQDSISAGGGTSRSQHWTMNDYWGSDIAKTANFNGSDLSPNQTVRFQGGKLVLEADVAAAEPGFVDSNGGDVAWTEVVWSAQQTLNSANTDDALYSYGYHRGFWTAGCRLQATRSLTCAVEADHDLASTTGDQFPCFSTPPARVMELSGHQQCGITHSGFSVDFGAPAAAWRICPAGTVDPCLDRFRFEWSQAGFVAYVNGIKFAEDSGWPAGSQLPASIVDGSTPVFAHFADWGDFSDTNVYRFHWARIAANPHDAAGNLLPPSASPTFGTTQPPPSPTPTSRPTPTTTPGAFSCNLRYGGAGHPGTCVRNPDGTVLFRPS